MSHESPEATPTTKGRLILAPWFHSVLLSATTIVATIAYFSVHLTNWHGSVRPVPGYGMRLENYLVGFRMISALLALVFGVWAVCRGEDKLRDWSVLGFALVAIVAGSFMLM